MEQFKAMEMILKVDVGGLKIYVGYDNTEVDPYLERFADAVKDAYETMDADAETCVVKIVVRTAFAVNFDTILAINVADHCEWIAEVLRNFLDLERMIREELDMPQSNIGFEMTAVRNIYNR